MKNRPELREGSGLRIRWFPAGYVLRRMPRKVLSQVVQALESDITTHFKPGDRYRTVREIAREQQISLATASKAVAELSERGWVRRIERDGIHIRERKPRRRRNREVAVISSQPDPRFNEAFLRGIRGVFGADPRGGETEVALHVNREIPLGSLAFGDWMLGLEADGYISLASGPHSGLPFYHVLKAEKPLVADWAIETLPILPVVVTDNSRHCRTLARQVAGAGKELCLLASFFRNRGQRHERVAEQLQRLAPDLELQLCDLASPAALGIVEAALAHSPERLAVLCLDFETNHLLVPAMQRLGSRAPTVFSIYDCEADHFPIPLTDVRLTPQGPSFELWGKKLAEKLRHHFEHGKWPAPLVERL